MNAAAQFHLDRRALRRAFSRASTGYDALARLQTAVRSELLTRLQYFPARPATVVDLGCGTGDGAQQLRARFRGARVLAVDAAPGMLREARRRSRPWRRIHCLCAEASALPLAAQSVDLVFSNLMMQWCDDLPALFAELGRVLRPGGLLLFSTFGPATLQELRLAWSAADDSPHVSAFADMPQLGAALAQGGLAEPVMDRELHTTHYADVTGLMQELRGLGAGNADAGRRRTLTGRGRLRRMSAAYEPLRTGAGLPASWEVIYGVAFGGARRGGERAPVAPVVRGETRLPLPRPRGR